jgi:hypothetical protein
MVPFRRSVSSRLASTRPHVLVSHSEIVITKEEEEEEAKEDS